MKQNNTKKTKPTQVVKKQSLAFSLSNKYISGIILSVILLFVALVRIRLLSIPLERDEGEYAYFGQLILKGIAPYLEAYNMKFPGTYFMYALIMKIFGQTMGGIHFGVMLISVASTWLLYAIVKKLCNPLTALITAAGFAIMSVSPAVLGFAGHATHFVLFFALAGIFLLLKARENNKILYYFLAGLLLGLAPIMKQAGAFFCVFGGLLLLSDFLLAEKKQFKSFVINTLALVAGGALPFLLMCTVLKLWGVFDQFWFWTITYAADYTDQVPLSEAWPSFKMNFDVIVTGFVPLWIFSGTGLLLLFFHKLTTPNKWVIFFFVLCAFLTICPGFYFRNHYFIPLLPAIALLFGISIDYLFTLSQSKPSLKYVSWIAVLLLIIPFYEGLKTFNDYLFSEKPVDICKQTYGGNPFVESPYIASFLKNNTTEQDKIAILGSEPQIFFYANRRSASGFIYTYSLMEIHKNSLAMQKKMISEIEKNNPKYLLFIRIPVSWLTRPNSVTYIFDWFNKYVNDKHYKLKGLVDIGGNQSNYIWDKDVETYKPQSESRIYIFERP